MSRPMYNVDRKEQEKIKKQNELLDGWTIFSCLIILLVTLIVLTH